MNRKGLSLLAMVMTAPGFAGGPAGMHQHDMHLCHSIRKHVLGTLQKHLYATTPAITQVLLEAMDGHVAKLRQALAAMPAKQAERWRQSAMGLAALAGHAAMVEALLDDGADATQGSWMPAFKPAFFHKVLDQAEHSPHFGGARGISALRKTGMIDNKPRREAPAIYASIQCNDLATVEVLLHHHVDPMRQPRPHVATPFIMAVLGGDADIVRVFLDHGAQPCVEDQRILANWKKTKRKHAVHTTASIGAKAGLSPALVKRLTCNAPHPAS